MTTNIITSNFKYRLARNFKDAVANNDTQLYAFYGRPTPWPNDDVPNELVDSYRQRNKTWANITALKKIYGVDITLAFRKIAWTSGTAYDFYTDDSDLAELDYYVITDANEVWKCIDNADGAASTVKPVQEDSQQTQVNIIDTADGYRWKYLFTVPDHLLRKFETTNYWPIHSNTEVVAAATKGTIDKIDVIDAGAGYAASADIPIFIEGDGDFNSSAEISISHISPTGEIELFAISNPGSNYTFDDSFNEVPVRVQQVFNQGAGGNPFLSAYGIATINTTTGKISSVSLVNPGQGYTLGTARVVQSSAYAYATTDAYGVIESITHVFAGVNFVEAEAILVAVDEPSTTAVIRPIISPYFGHGGDPERELNVNTCIFNIYTIFDENGDFSTTNDFRTTGIIEDPISNVTLAIAQDNSLDAKWTITLNESNAASFQHDEIIAGVASEGEGFVVDRPAANTLRFLKKNDATTFNVGETIRGKTSSTEATIASITEPEVVPYSGEILLINNGTSFERNIGQIESTTFIINF